MDRKSLFETWMLAMSDDDQPIRKDKAAALLRKSVRSIELYLAGTVVPPADTLLLMSAYAAGYRPKAWGSH